MMIGQQLTSEVAVTSEIKYLGQVSGGVRRRASNRAV